MRTVFTKVMPNRTLLLTSWYFPIKIMRWQDAVRMFFQEKIDVIVEYDDEIRSPSITIKTPAVIRLRKSVAKYKRGIKFSRINVYMRDGFCCQYCGNKFTMRALSYDHVTPRSAGGRTTWDNIVTACKNCNAKKDNRTCDEAGMWPIHEPKRPKNLPLVSPITGIRNPPEEWEPFLVACGFSCNGQ